MKHKDGLILSLTGPRPQNLDNDFTLTSDLNNKLRNRLREFIVSMNPTFMISGGALGSDMIWAELAIEMNRKLILYLSCKNHNTKWGQKDKDKFQLILNKAYKIFYISEDYSYGCEQVRNIKMCKDSDMLIAINTNKPGGTMNCIKYAESIEMPILKVNPFKDL